MNGENISIKTIIGTILTGLSKAFDCISHVLLIAKLEAHGLVEKALSYIYSYGTNWIQCARVNDTKSDFQKINSVIASQRD